MSKQKRKWGKEAMTNNSQEEQDSEKQSVKYAWLAFLFFPLVALLFWLAKHLTG